MAAAESRQVVACTLCHGSADHHLRHLKQADKATSWGDSDLLQDSWRGGIVKNYLTKLRLKQKLNRFKRN